MIQISSMYYQAALPCRESVENLSEGGVLFNHFLYSTLAFPQTE